MQTNIDFNDVKKIKLIPEAFGKNGYKYRLLERSTAVALYEQLDGGAVVGYEVHKIRARKLTPTALGDKKYIGMGYTHTEYLASNEDFGMYGWSFDTLQMAKMKFTELNNQQNKENNIK